VADHTPRDVSGDELMMKTLKIIGWRTSLIVYAVTLIPFFTMFSMVHAAFEVLCDAFIKTKESASEAWDDKGVLKDD